MNAPKFSGFGDDFDKPSACSLYLRECARTHTQPKYEDWFEASLEDAVESVLQNDPVWIAYCQEEEDHPDTPPEIEGHLHEVEEDMRKVLKRNNEADAHQQFKQEVREWQEEHAEDGQDEDLDDDAHELLNAMNGDLGFGRDSGDTDDVADYNDFLENCDKD
jgi:hypothetical protein